MERKRGIHLDALYRVIDEPDDVQFVEGRFKLLFDRLKDISNLGLIPEIFKMAKYSKFEHSFGTVHQVANLLETMRLPSEYHRPLTLAALFLHLGHLPFTYSSERALLIACANQNKPEKRNRAKEYVEKRITKCFDKCPTFDSAYRAHSLSNLFSLHDYTALYRYFAGELLVNEFAVLHKEFEDFGDDGFLFALKDLIDKRNIGYKYLDLADTSDFVQRDALYFGSIKLDIAPQHLFSPLANVKPSDDSEKKLIEENFGEANLIKANLDYLEEHFYKDPNVVWFSALYEKIVASLMNHANFQFERLAEYNDDQFKKLLTTNSDTKARLPARWVERASQLFDQRINFALVFSVDVVAPSDSNVIDIECELTSKKSNGSSYLSYPFDTGILVAAHEKETHLPLRLDTRTFSISLFQDTNRRCLLPLLFVSKRLSPYLAVSVTQAIQTGLGSLISTTGEARFDNVEIIRAIAEAVRMIDTENRKQHDFVRGYVSSLRSLITFKNLWANFENFAALNPWPVTSTGQRTPEKDAHNYEVFVKGLLSLPIKLLQYNSTRKYLDQIYVKLEKLAREEAPSAKKGALFEALCLLYVMRQPKGKFQLICNDLVVVNPRKLEGSQDDNEYDIVEFVINDEGRPECCVYACFVGESSLNAPALRALVDYIRKYFKDTIPTAASMTPTSNDDYTPHIDECGIGYRTPLKDGC